ncbi:HAMP domain-containing sensor histidine kinase [Lentzea sp. NBRC 102530]|uniref:sensor histidine kinase n=1 Tax=Lentzea sp. NBRC 102530 TaxID=3032201 RepID=UPI0024A32730|nr:HAMP domain-containing sensor histidine kinase [Lentzea sp. NBRC 102530]GLY54691.1 two-component sensor histidine kinase [Lentzea sp. NBRC 102530]
MNLRTVSLRRRVVVSVLLVLFLVLVALVISVDRTFATQSSRDVDGVLVNTENRAVEMLKNGRRPAEVVGLLTKRNVHVTIEQPNGTTIGVKPDGQFEARNRVVGRNKITFYADTEAISNAQHRLRKLLLILGLVAIGVTGLLIVVAVRKALAPLDAMTSLAQSIAAGHRGGRLNPSRTDTELGRTAAAFDGMLDSLEGSEQRTRRFVADAAHELRTPITGVQAVAEALVQAPVDSPDRDQMSFLLVREARRAGRLVDDLLALAQLDAGYEMQRESVDLLGLAEAEVARTRFVAPDFDIAAEGVPVAVVGDGQRLAQVLANLVDNARQATGPTGTVRIRVDLTGFTVSDNGPGVPDAERERIFDRLVRLDDARDRRSGGSGLGLAIARGVVRAHGGDLTCEPSASGAVFRVRLPAVNPVATPVVL